MEEREDDLFDEEPDLLVQEGPGLFDDFEPDEPDLLAIEDPPGASALTGRPQADVDAALRDAVDARRTTGAPVERPDTPLALYRRYRPDTFAEVIGQEHVTDPLQRALVNNRVNHAYLFSGPRGCGKTTSARILARALNCEQGPTPIPCGECQSCRDLARGGPGSIDVIEIDAASHGGVDDARDLRERAFFAPVHSRYKIYIIDEAHMVTTQGFNAMLKVVEEPPPHVKFIFATTEPDKVIGTIRSRTHHYPFRLVPPKVLSGYLAQVCESEGVAVEPAVLPLVVRAGAGSVRDSLSVLDQLLGGAAETGVSYQQATALLGYTPDALLDEIVDAFAAGDAHGVFAAIDKVIEVGQDPRRFAEDLLRRLRDLIIVAAVPDALSSGLVDVAADQAERLASQASALGPGELTRAAEVLAVGLTEMRGTTAPRLHLELMCARVLLPGADVDDRGLHARLDRLERLTQLGTLPTADAARPAPAPTARPSTPAPATHPVPAPATTPSPGARSESGLGARPHEFESRVLSHEASQPAASAPVSRPDPPAPAESRLAAPQDEPTRSPAPASVGDPSAPPEASRPAHSGPSDAAASTPDPSPPWAESHPAQHEPPASAAPVPAAKTSSPETAPGTEPRPGSTGTPEPPAAPEPVEPTAPAQRGGFGVADLRRIWPDVLEEVKGRRRVTWILLSQNAQVVDVRDGTLTLGLANQGVRENFVRGTHADLLREALHQVTGLALHIEPIVDANAADPPAQPATPPPAPAPVPQRSSGAQEAREQLRRGRSGGSPTEPEPEPSRDDASVDDEVSSDELLIKHLGAELIEEQEA